MRNLVVLDPNAIMVEACRPRTPVNLVPATHYELDDLQTIRTKQWVADDGLCYDAEPWWNLGTAART